MAVTWPKLLALLIAAGYIVAAILLAPGPAMMIVASAAALAPVALIWFPERLGGSDVIRKKTILGNYDEPVSPLNRPMRDSPPALVVFMGWFFLVGLPPLVYLLMSP